MDDAHKCPEIFTAIKRSVDKKECRGSFFFPDRPAFHSRRKFSRRSDEVVEHKTLN
jgi:hypothetical protein